MNTVRGTFFDGSILPDSSPGWENGTRVEISADPGNEDDQGGDRESIARWIAWYDALEPLVLTSEDEQRIAGV